MWTSRVLNLLWNFYESVHLFILKWLSDPPLNEIQQHDTRMIFFSFGYDGEWARELGRLARKKTEKKTFSFSFPPENVVDARSYDIHGEAEEPQFCARAPAAEKALNSKFTANNIISSTILLHTAASVNNIWIEIESTNNCNIFSGLIILHHIIFLLSIFIFFSFEIIFTSTFVWRLPFLQKKKKFETRPLQVVCLGWVECWIANWMDALYGKKTHLSLLWDKSKIIKLWTRLKVCAIIVI